MRVCVVYDCLFPWTVGGAERWYHGVAERLAAEGASVTYLTLRQWPRGADPGVPGVRVVAVGPRAGLYTAAGRRRVWPPLLFGAGVLWHLLRHGRSYDVVHTASFPYFGLLSAGLVLRLGQRFRLVVDWHEVWTLGYWQDYLGRFAGRVGWWVQRACARIPQRAICFSRLHAERLRREGLRGSVTVLRGEYAGEAHPPVERYEPVVVFAGRHIPEKRVPALVPAIASARSRAPELRAEIYGDGPERERVVALVRDLELGEIVSVPGFVEPSAVEAAIARALCLVLPSRREGYGLVVVEALARGTPVVVVADPDSAATELVAEGVNGFIAPSASPADLASSILRVRDAGPALRASTAAWFAEHADELALATSLERVLRVYEA
jgi:glycosyltransferase involved in cell wall biosynthesis